MPAWDIDDDYLSGPAAVSLATPKETLYRTPSRSSRKSRRSVTPPRRVAGTPSPPAPMPGERAERNGKRVSKDASSENLSIMDPRRFTPTLHANLVSEILALRRDQDDKLKIIESLEGALHETKQAQDGAQKDLVDTSKENRSLKRQLALLEGGTSSALGELTRERDEAVESASDAKKRLDLAQRKLRSQETDSQRVHDQWAEEKDGWSEERRKYERKLHVAETRLKAVLDEVAAFQAAQMDAARNNNTHGQESDAEESGRDNDAASARSMSMTNSVRFSMINAYGKPNGNSLADELNYEDLDDEPTELDGRESALSHHLPHGHARNLSRDSMFTRKHRRNHSFDSLKRPASATRSRLFMNQSVLEALEGDDDEDDDTAVPAPVPVSYIDTGVQPSPPPSPKLEPAKPETPEPLSGAVKSLEMETSPRGDNEIEANQRRKRVQLKQPLSVGAPPLEAMVSAGSQTGEEPISPPKTPQSPFGPMSLPIPATIPIMVTTSTQTEENASRHAQRDFMPANPSPPPMLIPSINVQPPTSRPTTPREPRLPQHFKHFGCQVNLLNASVETADSGVQTEGIQIDKRLALLPAHLQPSSITSRPSSPVAPVAAAAPGPADLDKDFSPAPVAVPEVLPPRNPRRLASKRPPLEIPSSPVSVVDSETHDAYPGNNDDGPLSEQRGAPVRRPHRFSSLFAGFDTASSDEADEFGEDDLSDSEFRTALSAPRHASISSGPGKRASIGTIPTSPDQPPTRRQSGQSLAKSVGSEMYTSFSLADKDTFNKSRLGDRANGPPPAASSHQANKLRQPPKLQIGPVMQPSRARSPSVPDPSSNPPFPIPTRASSRRPPFTSSAPSDGQRSPTRADGWHGRSNSRSAYGTSSIRKVRSAAAIPRSHRHRRPGSRSPPPLSPSTEAPESPGLPPLPRNDLTTPRHRERGNSHYRRHRHELSTNTDKTNNTMHTNITNNTGNTTNTEPTSQASGSQSTGVVEAIAQTMVGEWMFKYVRRRKSFGVPDNGGKEDSGNDRHKRWVWLAPYERAILWSSKQPSSGSALLGKTGRKLAIQSVLDVKDDNAAPKGMGPAFNRSILILTPQRALKFTAVSAERHYVWLTALSFLAHSQQAVPDVISPPQPQVKQVPLPEIEAPKGKGRRPGIRDSIRLAKGRSGASKPDGIMIPDMPNIASAPPTAQVSQIDEVGTFRMPESIGAPSTVGTHTREQSGEAADPPFIPRFHDRSAVTHAHGRKRSNTGGHVPPPLSFRGFSGSAGHHAAGSIAGNSVGTAGSSDIYQSQGSSNNTTWGYLSQAGGSQRTSEASSRPSNFFDAIGTVRMEAFISPLAMNNVGGSNNNSQFGDYPNERDELRYIARRRSKEMRRRQSRSRQRDSSRGTRGTDDYYGGSRTAGEEDFFRDDPFRGF